jgi:potassium-dependent mechanosensitive channel
MTQTRAGRFLLACLFWLTAGASLLTAQEAPAPADPRAGGPSATAQPAPQPAAQNATTSTGADYAEWAAVASRAEATLQTGRATTFALQRTRAELVIWRDIFLAEQGVNAARIATVQSQIAALGPVPADGAPPEDPRVAERRAELEAQLAELRAPAIMAAEAYARANGMIGEIDSQLRARQTTQLLTRGISPLAPPAWIEAWNAITNRSVGLWKEVNTSLRSEIRRETLRKNWPSVLFFLALSGVILFRARRWIDMFEAEVVRLVPRANRILRLLFSTSAVLVPYLGLLALTWAFEASGMFGFRATQLINVVPTAGLLALAGHWLADQFMSRSYEAPPPFDFSDNRKAKGRRLIVQAGWVMAAVTIWQAFLATGDLVPHARAALSLPFDLALAFVLFRLGKLFSRTTGSVQEGEPDGTTFRRNMLRFAGRLTMLTATLAPILAIIGFSAAAAAILVPTVATLFVLAVVVRLQWLAHDLYSLVMRSEEASRDALIPVLVGILLLLVALPVLAVVWGARVEDLVEIWARFREGVAFGDTRISPSDLIALVVVFGVGYALTRLIQSTLRTTILPRTKLDPGGRMAVVAGVGYVGIFVAALAAISSAGLDLSNLAIVAGALSVGIGFGLQNIVSNFVSGSSC